MQQNYVNAGPCSNGSKGRMGIDPSNIALLIPFEYQELCSKIVINTLRKRKKMQWKEKLKISFAVKTALNNHSLRKISQ